MSKDPNFYLGHVIEAIEKIQKYTKGFDRSDFLENELVQDAVVRNIEIIGEAVKNLPNDFKKKHSNVPWRDIAGMRDRIVHFYFGIDFELVWDTIETDIPELEKKISKLIK
ncbi:DUF86 domain-containing protein [Candidatus Micrarchaeota archaeon]|nr:DUF86 domain-containing protein [Candidatus Micrarchaeota archaeon]